VENVGELAGEILIEKSATDVADLYKDLVSALGWYVQIESSLQIRGGPNCSRSARTRSMTLVRKSE
jgi:hypothetical protein